MMMAFFRKKVTDVSAPDLERELEKAEKHYKASRDEFHKKKSTSSMTALEQILEAMSSGKLKKEDI